MSFFEGLRRAYSLDEVRERQTREYQHEREAREGWQAGRASVPSVEPEFVVLSHVAYTGLQKKMQWAHSRPCDPIVCTHFQYYSMSHSPWSGKTLEVLDWIADFCAANARIERTRIDRRDKFPTKEDIFPALNYGAI